MKKMYNLDALQSVNRYGLGDTTENSQKPMGPNWDIVWRLNQDPLCSLWTCLIFNLFFNYKFSIPLNSLFPFHFFFSFIWTDLVSKDNLNMLRLYFQGIESKVRTSTGMFLSSEEKRYPMVQVSLLSNLFLITFILLWENLEA